MVGEDLANMGRKIHTAWETGEDSGLDEVEKQIFDEGNRYLKMLIEYWEKGEHGNLGT